jgi:hypothetical protein
LFVSLKYLNNKNIFLFDAIGAALSLVVTAGILPFFSEEIGIPKKILYFLAVFPLIYGLYSFVCFSLSVRKAWMLLALVFANSFYGVLSLGLMLFYSGLTFWGYAVLTSELLVLTAVVYTELIIYKKEF